MATEVARPNVVSRVTTFLKDVVAEMDKVTWPDRTQVRQLSVIVVILSVVVGGIIALMDLVLQLGLVRLIPSLFSGG